MEKGASIDRAEAAQKPDSNSWCWECRRRRLVCDCARPVCNKCKATGIVCPGYEDKKPLTWLAPGRVLSRPRKARGRPSSKRVAVEKAKDVPSSSVPTMALTPSPSPSREVTRMSSPVYSRVQLRTDICDFMEAAHYYNSAIYPELVSNQLSPNQFVVPALEMQDLPTSIKHALVTMAFGHRLYRSSAPMALPLSSGVTSASAQKTWWIRLHHHRGLAIRLVSDSIGNEATRASDETITSVLVFLIGELQQSISHTWKHHVGGLMALLELRGGFGEVLRSSENMRPLLVAFLLVAVTANTTSPARDQIEVTSLTHMLGLVSALFGMSTYPSFPCPQYLFLDIIHINHLRARAAAAADAHDAAARHESPPEAAVWTAEAHGLLEHVGDFAPERWVEDSSGGTPLREARLLLARIYHAAVTLYCISSLQSVGLLPPRPQLRTRRAEGRDRLMVLLAEGLESPLMRKSLLWPLIVAGFEACDGSEVERKFVARHLEEQSRELGTSQPLVAKAVFERFWSGGRTTWDDCFDRPYALLA